MGFVKARTDKLAHDDHSAAHERHRAVRHIELLAHRLQEYRLWAERAEFEYEHHRRHCTTTRYITNLILVYYTVK